MIDHDIRLENRIPKNDGEHIILKVVIGVVF
jgi:hypothetical protein